MRRSIGFLVVIALVLLLVEASVLPPTQSAAASSPRVASPAVAQPLIAAPQAAPPCPPRDPALLFPPKLVNIPAFAPWGFPAYSGDRDLEPLPDSFNIVERPGWFNGIRVTIRPFPRPSVGFGGPDDNHADMYVFFYADGTPVPQLPMLEVVPRNALPPEANLPAAELALRDLEARMFSANWEVHVVRVPQDYMPGSIRTVLDLANPRFVLEDIQTNIFVTFAINPRQSTIPGLEQNGLSVDTGTIRGKPVTFVEYDVWENEYTQKPIYVTRKPSGEFVGAPILSGIPGMPHYSALWDLFAVEVPANYVADTLKSEDSVLASGYPIREIMDVFAPVESVDGMRTAFSTKEDILLGPDRKFHKDRLPKKMAFPEQPWFKDPRFNPVTLGFSMEFSFNEVEIPRLQRVPAPADAVAAAHAEALGAEVVNGCAPIILPPHIARQLLVQDANGVLTHLSQAAVDNMPVDEIISRGQALFEREIFEHEGAGPALNAYSCATCHGLPFNGGVEPAAGGPGVRFRNALQPTESGLKTSRNTPHVFGSGVLTQLGKERHANGEPVTDANPLPHNWKGNVPSIRAFTAGALNGEIGLQAVEKVAELAGVSLAQAATLDLDHDGFVAEMTVGDVTAMTAFQQSLPRPYQIDPSDSHVLKGRRVFDSVGCAACHTAVQTLQSTILDLANPETNGVVRIPLGSPTVDLFSDLKRHKMGSLLAEPGAQGGIPADVFKTKELWGIADSAPYLHDGSANTLEEAIAKHGGQGSEALPAVTAFNALAAGDKSDLIRFLKSLVLPRHRDLEIAAFNRLTAVDKAILGPFLPSLFQGLPQGPLLVAWIVNPPPEGSGKVKGQITIQVSITAEAGFDQAFVVVDGKTSLPLVYNFATGFHEAQLNTTALSEGDHTLTVDIRTSGSNNDRQRVVNTAVVTVDNIPDTSPNNFPSNFVGPQCAR